MPPERFQDPLIGKKFRKDQSLSIVQKIGDGGLCNVYLGWDKKHDRAVAVKVLRQRAGTKPQTLERFRREGQRFGRLRHPNLVQIYGTGSHSGMLYIVIEYVRGRNLYEILDEDGPFAVQEAVRICRDIADGLREAHDNQVVHRDLKPENVMVRNDDGAVKVLDFGIAKDLGASEDSALTQTGIYIGTPAYSAPEQIHGLQVDHRADIFSLGVILYEMLTGKVAFGGRHSTEVLRATVVENPTPITRLNREVTTPIALLIDKMIQKKPEDRPATMNDVIDSLDEITNDLETKGEAEASGTIRNMLKKVFER